MIPELLWIFPLKVLYVDFLFDPRTSFGSDVGDISATRVRNGLIDDDNLLILIGEARKCDSQP